MRCRWFKGSVYIIPTIIVYDQCYMYRGTAYSIEFVWLGLHIIVTIRGKQWDENL